MYEWKFFGNNYLWIKFDVEKQVIYVFLIDKEIVGIYEFLMIVRDKDGNMGVDVFQINVVDDLLVFYNYWFILEVDYDYEEFFKDFDN